ncbi:hypothetical protein SKa4_00230 [Pseudomonas phage vB_PpuM-SKa-4]
MTQITKMDFEQDLLLFYDFVKTTQDSESASSVWDSFRYAYLRLLILKGMTLPPATNWTEQGIDSAVDLQLERILGVYRPAKEA